MVKDPYEVLGITRNATQDEIKSAYRKAAKKYHPDLHPDDPEAARKMNEVNQAYDMLMNPERYANQNTYADNPSQPSTSYSYYSDDGYMNMDDLLRMFGFYQRTTSPFAAAENFIRNGRYAEAVEHLERYNASLRNAQWYYLYALANEGTGHHDTALEAVKAAVQMNPYNMEYQQLYSQLSGSTNINHTYSMHRSPVSTGLRILSGIFLLNMLFWILEFIFMGLAW